MQNSIRKEIESIISNYPFQSQLISDMLDKYDQNQLCEQIILILIDTNLNESLKEKCIDGFQLCLKRIIQSQSDYITQSLIQSLILYMIQKNESFTRKLKIVQQCSQIINIYIRKQNNQQMVHDANLIQQIQNQISIFINNIEIENIEIIIILLWLLFHSYNFNKKNVDKQTIQLLFNFIQQYQNIQDTYQSQINQHLQQQYQYAELMLFKLINKVLKQISKKLFQQLNMTTQTLETLFLLIKKTILRYCEIYQFSNTQKTRFSKLQFCYKDTFINIIICILYFHTQNYVKFSESIINDIEDFTMKIIETLYYFVTSQEYHIISQKINLNSNLQIIAILHLMVQVEQLPKIMYFFKINRQIIIVDFIYPLLISNTQELETLLKQPSDYRIYMDDLVDRQKIISMKGKCVKFLEFLLDFFDDSATLLNQICIFILGYSVNQISDQEYYDWYGHTNLYEEIQNKPLMQILSPKDRIDVTFILLTAASYIIYKQANQLELIIQLLIQTKDYLVNTEDVLLQYRFCLFLEFYYDLIIESDKSQQIQLPLIDFVMKCLLCKSEALRLIAFDSQIEIWKDKNEDEAKQYWIPLILQCFQENYNNEPYLKTTSFLISNFPMSFLDNEVIVINYFKHVVTALQLVMTKQNKNEQDNTLMLSYLQIITVLSSQQKLVSFFSTFEKIFCQLYSVIPSLDENLEEFSQNLYIVNQIIKETRSVSNKQIYFFENIMNQLLINPSLLQHYSLTICYIFIYGKQNFRDHEKQQTLFSTLWLLISETAENVHNEIAVNLIRLGLIKLNKTIHPIIFESLIIQVLKTMNSYTESNQEYFTLISTILLTSFSQIYERTFNLTTDAITQISKQMLTFKYENVLDKKLFIQFLCRFIQIEQQQISKGIQYLEYLFKQINQNNQNNEVEDKNEGNDQEINEIDENDENNTQFQNLKNKYIDINIDINFITIKDILIEESKCNIIQEFKLMIETIMNRPQIYNQLLQELSDSTKQWINETLQLNE